MTDQYYVLIVVNIVNIVITSPHVIHAIVGLMKRLYAQLASNQEYYQIVLALMENLMILQIVKVYFNIKNTL